jgi:hypothetical protein
MARSTGPNPSGSFAAPTQPEAQLGLLGSGSGPGPIVGKITIANGDFDAENWGNLPPAKLDIPSQKHLPEGEFGQGPPSHFGSAPLPGAAVFVEGPPRRPDIKHDHGFLDDGNGNIDPKKFEAPTQQDKDLKELWKGILGLSKQRRPELVDANRAYEHFLVDNNGEPLTLRYDGFIKEDTNGKTVLGSAVDDTRTGVLDVFDRKFPGPATTSRRDQLSVTSNAVTVGGTDLRYPYPATTNWQKAIGGHALWISASADIDSDPAANTRKVAIFFVLHAEDMYNFNPGNTDIETNIPDQQNGRFEITRLGTEFLQTGLALGTINFTITNTKQANNRVVPADQRVFFP